MPSPSDFLDVIIIAAGPLAVLFWPGVVLVIVGCCVIARQREVKTPIGPRVALLVIPIGAPLIFGAIGAERSTATSGAVPEWGDHALFAALAASSSSVSPSSGPGTEHACGRRCLRWVLASSTSRCRRLRISA